MDHITPFTHAVFQGMEAQRRITAEKQRQIRQSQDDEKDAAARQDTYEHQVESLEEDHPDADGNHPKRQMPHRAHSDEDSDNPHLDLTA